MPDMLVRYKSGKSHLEVATHEGAVTKYRADEVASLADVLVTDVIFTDYGKGLRASDADVAAVFGEGTPRERVLDTILRRGDYQLSAAERRARTDAKRHAVINYIHANYVEPKSMLPLPVMRIEQALETVRARIDMDQPAEKQVAELAPKLLTVMPMKKHVMEGVLRVPHRQLGAATGVIHSWCSVTREQYSSEGAVFDVQVSPGDYDALIRALSSTTKGDFQFDVAGAEASSAASGEGGGGSAGGKKKGGKKGGKHGGRK